MTSTAADKPKIEWSFWSGQVVNNQLNPIHLALGIRGYQIQSEFYIFPNDGAFSRPARLVSRSTKVTLLLMPAA
ncbi:hypothetical protein CHU98_g4132 [Xylaria longipes]|nr:hypothetical protein CHU98_g4132 [Xylaria longipes]